jgi:hypothetical protein
LDHDTPVNHWGSADAFYPIRWIEQFKLWLPAFRDEVYDRISDAYFVSCFNSMHEYLGLSPRCPPSGSFLYEVFQKYVPDRLLCASWTEDEVDAHIIRWFSTRPWAGSELRKVCDYSGVTANASAILGRIPTDED